MSSPAGGPPQESFADALARVTRPPRVVPALIALNVVAFVALALAGAGVLSPQPAVHVRWGSNFGPLTAEGEWWRLPTSAFVHFGLLHLALNMWVLWDAGRVAERLFGAAAFLAIYLVAAVVAALASVAWNPWVNAAGASGAIFGVIGALAVYMADRSHGVPFAVMRAHRNSTVVFIAYSIVFGLIAPGVDNAAHLGGLAAGFAAGAALAPRPATGRRGAAQLVAVPALAAVLVACLWAALPAPGWTQRQQAAAEAAMREFLDREAETVRLARTVLDPLKRGELPAKMAADRLDAEVVPRWEAAHRALSAVAVPEAAPAAPRLKLMLRYTAVRREMLSELAQGLRLDDTQRLEHANKLAGESHRLLDELQRLARGAK